MTSLVLLILIHKKGRKGERILKGCLNDNSYFFNILFSLFNSFFFSFSQLKSIFSHMSRDIDHAITFLAKNFSVCVCSDKILIKNWVINMCFLLF
jgi:hypothetical protein